MRLTTLTVAASALFVGILGQRTLYSSGRAPALPLAVRSPYTSAWIPTANNGALNSQWPIFWDGSTLGWEGIVTVDGTSYEWMGVGSRDLPQLSDFVAATPMSMTYDSSYTNFTFAAGPVELTASFLSPVIPQDLCRTSIPLSYLMVSVLARDNDTHNVRLYTDVNGGWVTQPAAPLTWSMHEPTAPVNGSNATTDPSIEPHTWIVQLQTQYLFGEHEGQDWARQGQGVFPQWGNFTWSSSQGSAQNMTFHSGYSVNQRFKYVTGQPLNNIVDSNFRSYRDAEPVFAFQHDLGEIGTQPIEPIQFTIGHVVTPAIHFLSPSGIESLDPWWVNCYNADHLGLVRAHFHDLSEAQRLAADFEAKLRNDIDAYYATEEPYNLTTTTNNDLSTTGTDQFGNEHPFDPSNGYGYLQTSNNNTCAANGLAIPHASESHSYYAITALAARQILAAYEITLPSSKTVLNTTEPLAFQKEISSNGNTNTVDVIYPAMPFFLWCAPSYLRYVLSPLFINQENNFYPNDYSMHDLGSHFPNATGHVEGSDEYMPVEESGNMVVMVYALYVFQDRDVEYLREHYEILKQWAKYLVEYSLIPAAQLSTDDFAGPLANQTNLAIKGIIGLACMSEISRAVGDAEAADNYARIAQDYYTHWETLAISPDPPGKKHTLLAYQHRSSWGLLYNIYPAKLLNLTIVPGSLYKQQSDFYPSVSQQWGVPLDSRHAWTKSDWEMWVAATCEPATRRLFVISLAGWLEGTGSQRPFTDLFETVGTGESPGGIEFFARPVQGGLFSLLALGAAGVRGDGKHRVSGNDLAG